MDNISMSELSLFTKYYHAKKTSIEMAIDRGFNVGDDSEILKMNLEDFVNNSIKKTGSFTLVKSSLNREYRNGKGDLLLFRFEESSDATQQGVDFAKDFIKRMSETTGRRRFGISIINQPLSHDARQLLGKKYDFQLQVFQLADLQFNCTRHMFSAMKYTSMTGKEQKEFLLKEKIKPKQLPQMSFEDPVVRYFGWQVGQVIRKEISSLTSETLTDEFVEYSIVDSTAF